MFSNIKQALKRDSLRSPQNKGVLSYIQRKVKPRKKIPNRYFSIFLTTHCNLNCFSCGALGMNPRPKIEYTTLKQIEEFLELMQGIKPNSYIMLTGGEPTLYPELEEACELIRNYGFHPSMLTNGCKIVPVKWFDAIMLDDHGPSNSKEVKAWIKHLTGSNIIWDVHQKQWHQDMNFAMDGNITKGLRCSNFLKPLTLWKDVIYPCCNIMCLQWWHDQDISEAFKRARWTIHNGDFAETFRLWRDTLPLEFFKMCSLQCWRDTSQRKWVKLARAHRNIDDRKLAVKL